MLIRDETPLGRIGSRLLGSQPGDGQGGSDLDVGRCTQADAGGRSTARIGGNRARKTRTRGGTINSIGVVLVGGMSIGTMFTLFIVPSVCVLLAKDHSRERATVREVETALRGEAAMPSA
jgi:hypothetical protein